jgi:hypothetical protein
VFERHKNVALACEALRERAVQPRNTGQLQRDVPMKQPVDALRQPHRAHPAFPDLAAQPIRSHQVAGLQEIVHGRRGARGCGEIWAACTIDFFGGRDNAYAVAQQPDGKLVVAAVAQNGGSVVFALARLMP